MKVEIFLTRRDLIAGLWLTQFYTPFFMVLWSALSFYIACDLASLEEVKDPILVGMIAFVLCFGVLAAAMLLIFAAYVLVNPKLKKGTLGAHVFSVTDEGLVESTSYNDTRHNWNSVDKVKTRLGYILIRVSGHLWHVIPTRYLAGQAGCETFVKSLQQRIEAFKPR